MANDHYVSQAFMKFWSERIVTTRHGKERVSWDGFVWCFDFTTNTLEEVHTKDLFAVEGLNPEAVEKRLGKVLENHLARFIKFAGQHHTGDAYLPGGRTIHLEDDERLRAISIAFMIQMARGFDGTSGKLGTETSFILSAPDEVLHELETASGSTTGLRHSPCGRRAPLSPRDGMVLVPHHRPERGVAVWGFAIPLNPLMALLAVPRGVEWDVEREAEFLSLFSIGSRLVKRVVIPYVRRARTSRIS